MNGGNNCVEYQVQRAVVPLAAVLAEVDDRLVAFALRVLDDDVAQEHRMHFASLTGLLK